MVANNVVAIFEVLDDGSTGGPVATGTLVHPVLVLVHQPYVERLRNDGTRLRIGVAATSPEGAAPAMEVIDGRAVHPFADDDGGEPLLALELARPADVGAALLPGDDEPLRAELRRLATAEDAVAIRPVLPRGGGGFPGPPGHPICRFFPWICRPTDSGAGGNR